MIPENAGGNNTGGVNAVTFRRALLLLWNSGTTLATFYITYRLFTYSANFDPLPFPRWFSVTIAVIVLWTSLLFLWLTYLRTGQAGRKP